MKKCISCKYFENDLCKNAKNSIIEVANRRELMVKYKHIKDIKGCKNYDVKL